MRMRCFLALFLVFSCFELCALAQDQASSQNQPSASDATRSEAARKVVRKTVPAYPEVAKRMRLSGTVKVIAVVSPDGSVKAVQPLGGSPVLIQAAEEAVSSWKFVTAGGESKEVVEMHFNP